MPQALSVKAIRVFNRDDIPSPPVAGALYWVAKDRSILVGLANGLLEEYSSSVGVPDYNALANKPSINGVTLEGDLNAEDLDLLSDATYEHAQTTLAATWNIQHNLGKKYVDSLILDESDQEVVGLEDWAASTVNLLVIHFSEALAGKAIIK